MRWEKRAGAAPLGERRPLDGPIARESGRSGVGSGSSLGVSSTGSVGSAGSVGVVGSVVSGASSSGVSCSSG